MAATTLITIDISAIAAMYLQFWTRTALGKRSSTAIDAASIQALQAQYRLAISPAIVQAVPRRRYYVAAIPPDRLEPLCRSLIQIGASGQISLLVEPDGEVSAGLAFDTPVHALLGHFANNLSAISERRYQRLRHGKHIDSWYSPSIVLPGLPGMRTLTPPDLAPMVPASAGNDVVTLGMQVNPENGLAVGPWSIPKNHLTRGTLVAGTTGSGKTNSVLQLIKEVHSDAWIIVFDPKREYRCLQSTLNATVRSFTGSNLLTHNLLKPEGPSDIWAKQFASILAEVIFRSNPAAGYKSVVIQELDRLYRDRGIPEGSADFPHVGHLVEALKNRAHFAPPRERGWIDSALRVLEPLGIGSARQAFHVREGQSLAGLLDGLTVIELDSIGDPDAGALLVSVLLQKLRNRQDNQPPHASLQGLIVVEEAQHLLAQGQEATSTIATACREIRSLGIGLVLVTQLPSQFTKHALANVNTLIAHRLSLPDDANLMARFTELPDASLLRTLPVGTCIASMDAPVMVQVQPQVRPFLRDDQIHSNLPTRRDVATSFAQRGEVARRAARLRAHEREVLQMVLTGQAVHPTAIREALPHISSRVQSALSALIRAGFLAYCRASRDGPGAPRSIYFPLPYGEEAGRQLAGSYQDRLHGRAIPHAQAVRIVESALSAPHLASPRFDIITFLAGDHIAIEVETGSNNDTQIAANLEAMAESQELPRFVVTGQTVGNRVLQAAARMTYAGRPHLTVALAHLHDPTVWTTWRFRSPTTS